MKQTRLRTLLAMLALTAACAHAQDRPLMGMLTWNVMEHDISSDKMKILADAMDDLGLKDAGYTYLCLDDCWAKPERNEAGELQPDLDKFPDGLKALTDYIHSKGLRAGIYSDAGSHTCSWAQPGSYGHERTDARCFAQWGFDLLKYDFCNNPGNCTDTAISVYGKMNLALKEYCPKDFIYYICEWGRLEPWLWAHTVGGNCWRATDDTRDCWQNPTYKGGVLDNIEIFKRIWPHTSQGRWNDADMLMCGLHGTGKSSNAGTDGKGMTQDEYRTQFILWCMWSSPLTLCFDITTLYDGHSRISDLYNPYYKEDLAIVTNRDIIAIDQDAACSCARPLPSSDNQLVLVKNLHGGDLAISITNLSDHEATLSATFCEEMKLERGKAYRLRDLSTGHMLDGTYRLGDRLSATLPSHGTIVVRATAIK